MSRDDAIQGEAGSLEAALQSRLGGRLRDLRVRVRGPVLVLQGRVASYYEKQLALQAAFEATGHPSLANEIEVCQVGGRRP
jgi:hypothetical protein